MKEELNEYKSKKTKKKNQTVIIGRLVQDLEIKELERKEVPE